MEQDQEHKEGLPLYETQFQFVAKRFMRHKLAVAGGVVIIILFILCFGAGLFAPKDPLYVDIPQRFKPPASSVDFILGTDELGRDILSRLLHGGQVSLIVGITAMLASILTGTLVGLVAGFYGGFVDNLLMRLTDTLLCFPSVFILLLLTAFIPPTVISISLIIGFVSWMEVSRIIRSQILQIREQDYIQAAVALGSSDWRMMLKEILPNCMAPVLVAATLSVARGVLIEAYVSFLGYGIQPPLASWGNMLNNSQAYFDTAPWLAIIPGAMITVTVMAFNYLGDGLRDALDPRLRM